MTVWQVKIGDEWRYATPDTAALVNVVRPGNVRLYTMRVPTSISYRREPKATNAREITPRRIKCAEKALEREREQSGLFAGQLKQPTPIERIKAFDQGFHDWQCERRRAHATTWKRARSLLRQQPPSTQANLLFAWSVCGQPKTSEWFIVFVREFLRK